MILAVDCVKDLGVPLGYRVCPLQCTGLLCNRFCPTDARSGQYEPLTVFDNDINDNEVQTSRLATLREALTVS